MNNKPVAWMDKRTSKCVVFINTPPSDDWIPLYTHPADESFDRTASHMAGEYVSYPAKTLTDEEIRALWNPMPDTKVYVRDLLEFARAILRKAQE